MSFGTWLDFWLNESHFFHDCVRVLIPEPVVQSAPRDYAKPAYTAVDPEWIALSVLSCTGKFQVSIAGYGGTKTQLSLSDAKQITFCVPDREEQIITLSHIRSRSAKIDQMISLAVKAITRLTEYCAALITAATTGQIDVRHIPIPAQA